MSSEDLEAANGGFGSYVLKLFALLHLNSTENSTSSAAAVRTPFSSAALSKKRRSYSLPYFRRSVSKRANLHSSADINRPLSLTPPSPPPLQDPSIAETLTNVSDSSKPQFLKSPSPENSKNSDISLFTPSPPLPRPLPHSLSGPISSETHQQAAAQAVPPPQRLSTSDPITPERYQAAAAANTPLQSPAATRTLSIFPSSDQDSKDEYGKESVWIEQIGGGGGLIIHFKCPCGEDYEILLSGNSCYYKLM
ncbi:uncharacterized protein [Primulina huaijiensis]|uniref:uncharacterized protein n=1 Tax=Primulina huaijiensis TaxID=1492673 RepID=UPI003CC76A03